MTFEGEIEFIELAGGCHSSESVICVAKEIEMQMNTLANYFLKHPWIKLLIVPTTTPKD